MPTVPRYDTPQVSPQDLPGAQLQSERVTPVDNYAGQQAAQMGQGMQRLGSVGMDIAMDMQNQVDQVRVDDALNQAKEAALNLTYGKDVGFTNLKGQDALQRPDGMPLADEYQGKLQQQVASIGDGLSTDRQRALFNRNANDIVTSFTGQALQHELQEFKTYSLSVSEGVQKTAQNDIALNWNNPDATNSAIDRMKAEVYRQGKLQGMSAEWQEARARDVASSGHRLAAMTALENNNPAYAQAYVKRYASDMNADDILAVQGHVTKAMDAQIGMQAAHAAFSQANGSANPGDTERAFNILIGAESGGRQTGANGQPLTSSAGAVGVAQVMPGTGPEAAKLAGVAWDPDRFRNDAAYNRSLGLAYFQKQIQTFGGDLAKAYAAYNAGPGAVAKAEQQWEKGKSAGQPGTQNGWLAYLPQETQSYVTKNMTAFNAGGGTPSHISYADIDNALTSNPDLVSSPGALAAARQEAERLYKFNTQARKDQADQALGGAYKELLSNGGSFVGLSPSTRASLQPEDIPKVMDFAKKIAKGDDTTDLRAYQKLSDPSYLNSLSDGDFYRYRAVLSDGDFKHFSGERAKAQGTLTGANGPGDLNTGAIKSGLDQRLQMIGVNSSPKNGSDDAQRLGGIRQFVDQYMLTAQRESGKKFTDAEVSQRLDHLFATNETVKGWFSDSSKPMLAMNVGDIDSSTRDQIRAAYAKRGVTNPTDTQVLSLYWANQTYGRK